jgi:hypothetical protein
MGVSKQRKGPKALILDIETAPILAWVWKIWDQNIGLNQISNDWHVLSWSAKWLGDPASKIMYMDQRDAERIEDDSYILKALWDLIDEADIVITQNGVSFDIKKLNARFIINGLPPPSSYKNIDTKLIAKKRFGFTSNKLEYMTDKLCKKYKKLKHGKYPGFELWIAVLSGDLNAWKEMEKYNKYDVLSLEELFNKLIPWENNINFGIYSDNEVYRCTCGSEKFKKRGFYYTNTGKFQRYKCFKCGAENRDRTNLFTKEKSKSIRIGIPK